MVKIEPGGATGKEEREDECRRTRDPESVILLQRCNFEV